MTEWIETELKLGLPGADAWNRIRAALGPGAVVEQTNHFFEDRHGRLREARIGVRLRGERSPVGAADPDETHTLTVKSGGEAGPLPVATRSAPTADTRFVAQRLELETRLEASVFAASLRDGLRLLPFIERWRSRLQDVDQPSLAGFLETLEDRAGDAPLRRFAGFANRRECFRLELPDAEGSLHVELELDRTQLPGGRVDYEIEVEQTSEHSKDMTRTRRALIAWLDRLGEIRPVPFPSKLERLESILAESSRTMDRTLD